MFLGYNIDFLFLTFMFLTGIFVFCSMRKHLLVTLLSLEYLVLCIYMYFVFFIMNYFGDMYLILIFLTFSVCEGVLGLSVLVGLIRCHGNDHVNSLFLVKW
uniref:NADH-ubiquinone oxidoreductase chain 4L n=1 Tax=Rubeospineus bicorniger TaxID=2127017 RepID=A0A514LNF6_9HEMI|nr:NADH dehydrogenase subunit 4L [Rubeospineus bicorniger]QDI93371.1 NADH dehydrogenase subunit 4L [Rubeospineus bicorniger]